MAVTDWSTTPNSNTTISGINIAEGCPPSGINNAIRQMMADLKTEQGRVNTKISDDITSATASIIASISSYRVPVGTICMWSGSTSNIPTGWALCNGSGGTRDLRNRFIVGAGGSYAVGATGGNQSITPSGSVSTWVGSHVLSWNEMPSHNHRVSWEGAHGGSWYNGGGWLTTINSRDWSSYNVYCDNAGSSWGHDHGSSGSFSGYSFDNRPPYYALCFIQKVS